MYDPTTGRFINEDPIRDGLNWYVYCGGNPVMFVDPWGLYKLETDKSGNVYAVIESGDTLSGIAKAEVNDSSAWTKIGYKGNASNLQVGEKININGIYNENYRRPIKYERFYDIPIGDKNIKVALNNDVIRTNLVDGDAQQMLLENPRNSITIALVEKQFYRDVFGKNIEISDVSLSVELLGHVYPKLILDKLNLSKRITNPNVVDSGTIKNDGNRKVWDALSQNLSVDAYIDIFMRK